MQNQYSKAIRKKFRELAAKAYERELDQHLAMLNQRFDEWRQKKMSGFELNDLIHEFHQGASRELWKTYNYLDADMAVSRAVGKGILKKEEVPEELLNLISRQLDFLEKHQQENE